MSGFTTFTMSLAAAEAHLLKPRFIGKSSFDKYAVSVLRSLCTKFELEVVSSGKSAKPIKKDYIAALHDFVSMLKRPNRTDSDHNQRGKVIPIAPPGQQEIVVANASEPLRPASPVASVSPPQSDDIMMDPPQHYLDIPNELFDMQGNPLLVEQPRQSRLSDNPRISISSGKKDKRSEPAKSHRYDTHGLQ
jgi:hypothetical protein